MIRSTRRAACRRKTLGEPGVVVRDREALGLYFGGKDEVVVRGEFFAYLEVGERNSLNWASGWVRAMQHLRITMR
jgi:hypothetical protein